MGSYMITVFGSLNVDYVFQVAQLPAPGETVLAANMEVLPGGKGGNQALAAAKAGAKVHMVGAVGKDGLGDIAMAGLIAAGVDTSAVIQNLKPTGTAAINVDSLGENAITVSSGANLEATGKSLDATQLNSQTILLLQMEVVCAMAYSRLSPAKSHLVLTLPLVFEGFHVKKNTSLKPCI